VLRFTSNAGPANHIVADDEQVAEAVEVDVTTLDDVLQKQEPFMLKVDVEGYETPVFRGAAQTLRSPALSAVLVELNGNGQRYGFDEGALTQQFIDLGFMPFSYDPWTRKLTELQGKNAELGNTLFVRNRDVVEERLSSAQAITLHGHSF